MTRPGFYEWAMHLAKETAKRSTCLDKQVGAVLLDELGVVIATGYNGSPRDLDNCCDTGYCAVECIGDKFWCMAVHAEINAIIAAGKAARGSTLVCTDSPCRECTKAIINAGIKRIVYDRKWNKHHDAYRPAPADMLYKAGIKVNQYDKLLAEISQIQSTTGGRFSDLSGEH